MPRYSCRLVSPNGEIVEEEIEAESKFEVYDIAERRNEMVLSVKELKGPSAFQRFLQKIQTVNPQELENFTSQLAIMLRAGVPLVGALTSLVDQAETHRMREIINSLVEGLNSGKSLSEAMAEHPEAFNNLYVSMIKAGETAGVMDQILERLSTFIQHDLQVRRNIKAALRYPTIVFTAIILAFIGAIVFIIPKFAKLFASQGIELPLPTRIMVGISDFVIKFGPLIALLVFAGVIGWILYIRTPKGRWVADTIKLKLPVFKEIFQKATIARFAHMLETLSKGGIPIIRALEVTEGTVGNVVIGDTIRQAKEKVAEGVSLADALSPHRKYFPQATVKMIAVGEQSGALDKMLANVAEQYDLAVDAKIKRLSASLEPMLTVVMGAFLLLIALGIFLPMWRMYSAINQ